MKLNSLGFLEDDETILFRKFADKAYKFLDPFYMFEEFCKDNDINETNYKYALEFYKEHKWSFYGMGECCNYYCFKWMFHLDLLDQYGIDLFEDFEEIDEDNLGTMYTISENKDIISPIIIDKEIKPIELFETKIENSIKIDFSKFKYKPNVYRHKKTSKIFCFEEIIFNYNPFVMTPCLGQYDEFGECLACYFYPIVKRIRKTSSGDLELYSSLNILNLIEFKKLLDKYNYYVVTTKFDHFTKIYLRKNPEF